MNILCELYMSGWDERATIVLGAARLFWWLLFLSLGQIGGAREVVARAQERAIRNGKENEGC
jgi:hypothetical protein